MKKLYFFIALFIGFISQAQTITIPDANFKALVTNPNPLGTCARDINNEIMVVDTSGDGEIQVSEALGVYSFSLGARNISSLTGIEYFTNLRSLYCNANNIASVNVSTLTNLTSLDLNDNDLTTLNVAGLNNLQNLFCSGNLLTSLNANGLSNLLFLSCSTNHLTTLTVSGCTSLQNLYCDYNSLTSLNVANLSQVTSLQCSYNSLSSLSLTGLTSLKDLMCYNNQLPALNLSGLTAIENVFCNNNHITILNAGNFSTLTTLVCSYNQMTSLNVVGSNNLIKIDARVNSLPSLNLSGLSNLEELYLLVNQLTALNLSNLISLQIVDCHQNHIPTLDVSALSNLSYLDCGSNTMTSLTVGSIALLETLNFNSNSITSINLSGLSALKSLSCNFNLLTTLNASGLSALQSIDCKNNQLTSLNVGGLGNMTTLYCQNNSLPTLDVSSVLKLNFLDCTNNLLTTLDLNGLTNFSYLNAETNHLTSLFIKNGKNEQLALNYNPSLSYICADESQFTTIQTILGYYGVTNCQVNSYCTLVPGGVYYTIQGDVRFDMNANGCDNSDIAMPNMKFNLASITASGAMISNASGGYSIPVTAGSTTVTPVLENPTYFSISPASTTIAFPTQFSPFTQNFCLSANGTHNDLEITILPISRARPGFDATYKILYKNKGTAIQSGSVTLGFEDAKLDLILAIPAVSSQSANSLSWNFSNLLPFEQREIVFTMNINSPVETPAVNGGDILVYTATVIGTVDETPTDNAATLNQTVTNSFDPNDKTCLEGTAISPTMVGNYVHYIIRFENTGSDNAENIIVKDMIDANKYDISSLIPLNGSAPYVTRITNANQVEFIFENINLPFDDAHNDGYIAFKIKTKPTLVLGNTFSNAASIYFDYNSPIVTNTYTTTIAALATQDFEFENYFSLYPNPAKEVLNIEAKATIGMRSISIYNTIGQLVLAISNAENVSAIDVSNLRSGTYFIKINTDQGSANAKFIKD